MTQTCSLLISCSVLRGEIEELRRSGRLAGPVEFVESMLHMHPERLSRVLEASLSAAQGRGQRVTLVYGDCCPEMTELAARPEVARPPCQNCCDLLLGKEEFRQLCRQGAFLLIPEWTRRWRRIFVDELGLNAENAKDLMREMHTKLIYLDTGVVPVPREELRACAEYCGLPYEVRPTALDILCANLRQALGKAAPGTASSAAG